MNFFSDSIVHEEADEMRLGSKEEGNDERSECKQIPECEIDEEAENDKCDDEEMHRDAALLQLLSSPFDHSQTPFHSTHHTTFLSSVKSESNSFKGKVMVFANTTSSASHVSQLLSEHGMLLVQTSPRLVSQKECFLLRYRACSPLITDPYAYSR